MTTTSERNLPLQSVTSVTQTEKNANDVWMTSTEQVRLDDLATGLAPGKYFNQDTRTEFLVKTENPKAAFGAAKAPLFGIPWSAVAALGTVMGGGGYKYGLYNYRDTKIATSTYHDALLRHFMLWADGEDVDPVAVDGDPVPGSGVSHLAHIMACCALMIDAEVNGMLDDDRSKTGHMRAVLDQSKQDYQAFCANYDAYKEQT
jgi:hypothetical protein